jgi:hypothetical protein
LFACQGIQVICIISGYADDKKSRRAARVKEEGELGRKAVSDS